MKFFNFIFLAETTTILSFMTFPTWVSDLVNSQNPLLAEAIGLISGFRKTFAALPDLFAIIKNRSTKGMNPRMAAIIGSF